MNDLYDVAIVGCGIPGLYAGRELCKQGIKVIMFDKSKVKGEPNYSTAGIPSYLIEKFSLSVKSINADIRSISYSSVEETCKKDSEKVIAHVLDFIRTKNLLADEVESLGGRIIWECNINKVYNTQGIYILSSEENEYQSKYVIDASGLSSSIGEDMGVEEKIKDPLSIGIECIVKSSSEQFEKFKGDICFYLNTKLTPYGYGWVFDNGSNTYKIGVAEFYIDKNRNLLPLDKRLDDFLNYITKGEKCEILEKHGGTKLITDRYRTYFKDKMLGIGDSIGALNPFWGEGIRQGLDSARFAVETILDDMEHNNGLKQYKQKMDEYHNFKWKCSVILSRLIYKRPDQIVFDEMVRYMDKYMNVDDVLAMGFDYDINKMAMKSPLKFTLIALKLLF